MIYEKEADELAMASYLQDQMNESGVAAARAALAPQKADGFDGVHCIDCEDDLPPIRVVMGRVRCTTCQCAVEAEAKRRGR